jgi:CheY-like chemotaxis protein
VLIVEDNRDAADTLRLALELGGGCEVWVAYTGPDGVEAAKRLRPQLILCDIGLPGLSGFEVAKRIRAEANGAVVLVALTGYGRDEDRERARAAGFDRYFTKPIDFTDLEAVIGSVA